MSGGFVTRVGRRSRPTLSLQERRSRARDALVASGIQVETTYDVLRGGLLYRKFCELALAADHPEMRSVRWPTESTDLAEIDGEVLRSCHAAVFQRPDGTIAYVSLSMGWIEMEVVAPVAAAIEGLVLAFQDAYPATYVGGDADGQFRVPITFWMNGRYGAERRLRKIDSAAWADISVNYTATVREELEHLMSWQDGPAADGQLLLWQGPPGVGKSWCLRALAAEWASWAEFHYITDPDAFFVTAPSYMVEVLLSESYSAIEESTGDVVTADPLGKWRVLILEDTGELLAADSKANYGQGLSRLLNVVDGMIGQGLRVLAIVTTNDELGDLHPAVTRPGRCASQIEFGPLTAEEASEWLGVEVEEGGTLAELYAKRHALAAAEPEAPDPDLADVQAAADMAALLELARSPI